MRNVGIVVLFLGAIFIGVLVYTQSGFIDDGAWQSDGKLQLSGVLSSDSPYSEPENMEVMLFLGATQCASTLADANGYYSFTLTIGEPCPRYSSINIAEGEWTVEVSIYAQTIKVDLADNVHPIVNIVDGRSSREGGI